MKPTIALPTSGHGQNKLESQREKGEKRGELFCKTQQKNPTEELSGAARREERQDPGVRSREGAGKKGPSNTVGP